MGFFLKENNKSNKKCFSLLELIIALAVIGIMFGALTPMLTSFRVRQRLDTSIVKLLGDLRQAHQFARVQRDGFKYYGLRFFNNLGENNDRDGYKIVRYDPEDPVLPLDVVTACTGGVSPCTVIKGPDEAEAEIVEDTFFGERVIIDLASEFQVGATEVIVFTPEGSATLDGETDGDSMLNVTNDEIILSTAGYIKIIKISALTGYVRIMD